MEATLEKTVRMIPAKPEAQQKSHQQLRMAAYARVSTLADEQHLSYESQCEYYTDHIQKNNEWRFAGIFADEGISGTSTKKRDGFNRMIKQCRAGRIDMIITNAVITKGQFYKASKRPFYTTFVGHKQQKVAHNQRMCHSENPCAYCLSSPSVGQVALVAHNPVSF